MKKNFIYSLAATFITAALAMGSLTACSVDDIFASHHNAQAKTYTVSIPASIGEGSNTRAVSFDANGTDITTSFENTDKIYVALEHEGNIIGFGHTGSGSSGFMPLTVTPDAGDAKKAAISGALKFYNMDYLPPFYNPVDPSVGDLIHLYYNANSLNSDDGEISFNYTNQDGSNLNTTGAGSCDFALATMKVKSLTGNATDGYSLELCQIGDDSKSTALFENIGSMFRQHLTFKDKNSQDIAAPAIKKLSVGTKNGTLVWQYETKASDYRIGTVDATSATSVLDANNDVYLALMFHYDANHLAADDQLVLSAEATDGNVYQAAKNVPSGGFVPGKYYHGQMELAWLKQYVKPTVTRNDTHAAIDADDEGKRYNVYTSNGGDPIDITISGDSYGYDFVINSASTVTLTGNGTATVDENAGEFLWCYDNLTVNLDGDYTINCPYNNTAISLWGNLKLSGNGSLTVKVNNPDNCGLYSTKNYDSSNNNHDTTTELNVTSLLAADGFTVTRSARTVNTDGTYTWTYTVAPDPGKPLTLKAIQAGSVKVSSYGVHNLTHDITYKINGGATQTVNCGTAISLNADDEISFYSTNASLATSESDYIRIIPEIPCYVYGNVMSLIDDSGNGFATDKTISSDYALCQLFNFASNLRNHPSLPLLLPATTLTRSCYYRMFFGCSGLTTAPSLPAETMATSCYSGMFTGCTSLTAAPSLPAESLAESCYKSMFSGCTSLTAAPELKATTLANFCCNSMFRDCTNLTVAPELKATTLADYCYDSMFEDCTNLTVAPELKATTLADYCYSNMFRDCTNLITAPELKATTLANYCYNSMFRNCTNLTVAPELKATTLVNNCYSYMFYGCTNLASVKCLATSGLNNGNCIQWLHGVAASGTFTKSSNPFINWPSGESGIPTGWNVQEE